MILKIFKAPFNVDEFNAFYTTNLVATSQILSDGTIYLFYKSPREIGYTIIDEISDKDKYIQTLQARIGVSFMQNSQADTEISDLKQKIAEFHPNQAEWKDLDARIKAEERKKLLSADTIKMANQEILALKDSIDTQVNELLSKNNPDAIQK